MAIFKMVVNDPKTRKSFQIDVEQDKVVGLVGKKVGEDFNGDLIGFGGYTLQITGGTDKDGFPMHPDINGTGRRKLLLKDRPGYNPRVKGKRRRKMVCGNTISDSIVQINVKVVKEGDKSFDDRTGKTDAQPEGKTDEQTASKESDKGEKDNS